MEEIENFTNTLSNENSALRAQISYLNNKKQLFESQLPPTYLDTLKEKNELSMNLVPLMEKYEKINKNNNNFLSILQKTKEYDIENHFLADSLSQKFECISNLISHKNMHSELKYYNDNQLLYKKELQKTNEEIVAKDENLKLVKFKLHELTEEISKLQQKTHPQRVFTRAFSDLHDLKKLKTYTSNGFQDVYTVGPPQLESSNGFQQELPPINKKFFSEYIRKKTPKIFKNHNTRLSKIHQKEILKISQSKCGEWLMSFSSDKTFKCLNLLNNISFQGPRRDLIFYLSGDFRFDSRQILCGTTENNIEIFNLNPKTGLKLTKILKGHTGGVLESRYFDPFHGISCSDDLSIKLWDLNKGVNYMTYRPTSKCRNLDVHGEGYFFAGHNDGKLRVYSKDHKNSLYEIKLFEEGVMKFLKVAESGNYLIGLGYEANILKYLDLRTIKFIDIESNEISNNKYLNSVSFWSNESFLIGGGLKGELLIIDTIEKNNWRRFEAGLLRQAISCSLYNSVLKTVYTGDLDGSIISWDVKEDHIYGF